MRKKIRRENKKPVPLRSVLRLRKPAFVKNKCYRFRSRRPTPTNFWCTQRQ